MPNQRPAPRLRNSRRPSALPVHFEKLESRLLLSTAHTPAVIGTNFDIVPSMTKIPSLSNAVITGTTVTGSVTLTLTNTGTDPSPAATVSIFLRPANTTGSSDINITPVAASIPSINGSTTKKGKTTDATKNATVKVALPLTLAAGSYSVVIEVSDTSPIGSPAQLNNTLVIHPFTLNATAGFINLSDILTTTKIPSTIVVGSKAAGSISLKVTNNGNIATVGTLEYSVSLVLHPTSGAEIPLITGADAKFSTLKPNGGNKTLSTSLTLSALESAGIPAGSYSFIAKLTPVNGTPGTPFTVTGPSITFTASNSNPGSSLILKHGDTIAFTSSTQLTGSNFIEFGFFSTNLHTTGNYAFRPTGLVLTYSNGQTDTLAVTFIGPQTFLDKTLDGNPTTVIFSSNPAGAFASVLVSGSIQTDFAKFA